MLSRPGGPTEAVFHGHELPEALDVVDSADAVDAPMPAASWAGRRWCPATDAPGRLPSEEMPTSRSSVPAPERLAARIRS